jgi:hypothetical protein
MTVAPPHPADYRLPRRTDQVPAASVRKTSWLSLLFFNDENGRLVGVVVADRDHKQRSPARRDRVAWQPS